MYAFPTLERPMNATSGNLGGKNEELTAADPTNFSFRSKT
jgi:hypothetical protein